MTFDVATWPEWRKQLKPIGTCQGWPAADLYLETTSNKTFPYANSTAGHAVAVQAAGSSTGNATLGNGATSSVNGGMPAALALVLATMLAIGGLTI
jgi:hypothetical protein